MSASCPICNQRINHKQIFISECDHIFCKTCINTLCQQPNQSIVRCPVCRKQLKQANMQHHNNDNNMISARRNIGNRNNRNPGNNNRNPGNNDNNNENDYYYYPQQQNFV